MYRDASTYGFGRRYNSGDRARIFGVRVASPDTERLMELYISAGLFKEQNGREMYYYALFQGVEEWERKGYPL